MSCVVRCCSKKQIDSSSSNSKTPLTSELADSNLTACLDSLPLSLLHICPVGTEANSRFSHIYVRRPEVDTGCLSQLVFI